MRWCVLEPSKKEEEEEGDLLSNYSYFDCLFFKGCQQLELVLVLLHD